MTNEYVWEACLLSGFTKRVYEASIPMPGWLTCLGGGPFDGLLIEYVSQLGANVEASSGGTLIELGKPWEFGTEGRFEINERWQQSVSGVS